MLEALEHRVELDRQLPDLVIGVDPQPPAEIVGLADHLRRLR